MTRKQFLATLACSGSIIPKVFSDVGETIGFAENGDVYEAARYKLAKTIAAAAHG